MVLVEIDLDIIRIILEIIVGFGGFILYLLYKNTEADVEYYQTLWKHEQTTNKALRKQLEELEKDEGITDDE